MPFELKDRIEQAVRCINKVFETSLAVDCTLMVDGKFFIQGLDIKMTGASYVSKSLPDQIRGPASLIERDFMPLLEEMATFAAMTPERDMFGRARFG